jgi:hypothetical protein
VSWGTDRPSIRDEVFPPQIRREEIVLVWQAGKVAKELVKQELGEAIANADEHRVAILKRGATFFVLAIMGVILHERNGQTFLNKLKPEVASSKATIRRLKNYATIALEWYVEIMTELVTTGEDVASIVRSQTGWHKIKIKPKVAGKWKVYRLARRVMEESLPML